MLVLFAVKSRNPGSFQLTPCRQIPIGLEKVPIIVWDCNELSKLSNFIQGRGVKCNKSTSFFALSKLFWKCSTKKLINRSNSPYFTVIIILKTNWKIPYLLIIIYKRCFHWNHFCTTTGPQALTKHPSQVQTATDILKKIYPMYIHYIQCFYWLLVVLLILRLC